AATSTRSPSACRRHFEPALGKWKKLLPSRACSCYLARKYRTMDVPLIAMTQEEAQGKLDAWMRQKHADQADVRDQCIAGYKALAAGKTLLHLDEAIGGGGFYETGFPKLAVARADRKLVRLRWEPREA